MTNVPTHAVAALTTVFTPPSECANRYAVFIATPTPIGEIVTNPPSSGWIDPSFTKCNPPQYTNTYPTFSPGVCPQQMSIVSSASSVDSGKTRWTGACCQSGFSTAALDPRWICTSSVTTPMPFLLVPNISTADIYTTLADIGIQHDQVTVQWEEKDLSVFPASIAAHYASIMGESSAPQSTDPGISASPGMHPSSTTPATPAIPASTSSLYLAGSASSTEITITTAPPFAPAAPTPPSNPGSLTKRTTSGNGSVWFPNAKAILLLGGFVLSLTEVLCS